MLSEAISYTGLLQNRLVRNVKRVQQFMQFHHSAIPHNKLRHPLFFFLDAAILGFLGASEASVVVVAVLSLFSGDMGRSNALGASPGVPSAESGMSGSAMIDLRRSYRDEGLSSKAAAVCGGGVLRRSSRLVSCS